MYRIFEQHHNNEYGKRGDSSFFIKERKTFLGIPYWKDITHVEFGHEYDFKKRTTFGTEEKALKFIQTLLCTGIPKQKNVETLIKEVSCK